VTRDDADTFLVEIGYVTHEQEVQNLAKESYLKRLAGAISTGIAEFAMKRKKLS
jgi:N-acetylmuramoyl-L-alanine amidase